jgi:inner membrane transporter RhtA
MSARVYGVLACFEPIVAAVVGRILLSQSLTAWEGLAAVLIVAASVGVTRESAQQPEIAPN